MRPSALETTLCLTTRISPDSNTMWRSASDSRSFSARESLDWISSARTIGIRRISDCGLFDARFFLAPARLAGRVFTRSPSLWQETHPGVSTGEAGHERG